MEAHIDRVLSLEMTCMDVLFETAELQRRRIDIEKWQVRKKKGQDDDRSQALKSLCVLGTL